MIKIVNEPNKRVKYSELKPGDTFKFTHESEYVYMKIFFGSSFEIVNLATGYLINDDEATPNELINFDNIILVRCTLTYKKI